MRAPCVFFATIYITLPHHAAALSLTSGGRAHVAPVLDGDGKARESGELRLASADDRSANWTLVLPHPDHAGFKRTFTVDAPSCRGQGPCPESERGLPILVDLHGYGLSAHEEREWTSWVDYQHDTTGSSSKFILVTPDGSDDAVAGSPASRSLFQSWNVLGWSKQTSSRRGDFNKTGNYKSTGDDSFCMGWADAYCCYDTQTQKNPGACRQRQKHVRATSLLQIGTSSLFQKSAARTKPAAGATRFHADSSLSQFEKKRAASAAKCDSWSNTCSTASLQDDSQFMTQLLRFVVEHYQADASRIYLFGQSVGAMAALQFTAAGGLPEDVRPAAIVVSSGGAPPGQMVNLNGEVPALVMHGSFDTIVPPTPWSGMTTEGKRIINTLDFEEASMSMVDLSPRRLLMQLKSTSPAHEKLRREERRLLQADLRQGGSLLSKNLAPKLKGRVAYTHDGREAAVSADGYLYEIVPETLRGISGNEVDFSALTYQPSSAKVHAGSEMNCAKVPSKSDEVYFCPFEGAHCLPWQDDSCNWKDGKLGARAFHSFVWDDFLKGGTLRRKAVNVSRVPAA